MIIGVTGGVGAGKSTVLEILEQDYHAVLLIADDIAKQLSEPGEVSYFAVVEAFGPGILADEEDSSSLRPIDRAKLAAIVFNDDEKLALLNSLTHPLVKKRILDDIQKIQEKDPQSVIVIESAILIEAGYQEMIDELWVVTADRHVRIERLQRDRGYTVEKAESIMDNQLSDEVLKEHADVILDNSGTLEDIRKQIQAQFERNTNHH